MAVNPGTWDWVGIGVWAWRAAPLVLAVVGVTWVAVLSGQLHDATNLLRDLRGLLTDDGSGRHTEHPPARITSRPPVAPTRAPLTVPARVTVCHVPCDTNPIAAATAPTWNENAR